MKREEVEGIPVPEIQESELGELEFTVPRGYSGEGRVVFRLYTAGLGNHPDVPVGTILVHPASIPLFGGFLVEGDLVKVNTASDVLELVSSTLALPPILKKRNQVVVSQDPEKTRELLSSDYVALFSGGFLVHGKDFIPPLRFRWELFGRAVQAFKREEFDPFLYFLGIPDSEKYLHEIGPFFGYHVPEAVSLLDEKGPEELVREWTGSTLLELPFVDVTLVEHREYRMLDTGIHGYYPIKTPWPVRACPSGHLSPLKVCPLCGERTEPVEVCPLCGRVYPRGSGRCEVDGSQLISKITFNVKEAISHIVRTKGDLGEILVVDGFPEHPLKPYLRKKTNLTPGRLGFVEMEGPLYPGEETTIPYVLVNPLLRVYRFVSLVAREVFGEEVNVPGKAEDLVGREVVLVWRNVGWVVKVESVGGERLTLRSDLFYSLPRKDVRLAVLEDVLYNGWNIQLYHVKPGRSFPYSPYHSRSVFEAEMRVDRLVEMYLNVVSKIGADPSFSIPLLRPLLRDRESRLTKTVEYRCTSCGARYPRPPLSSRCVRCGGEVKAVEEVGRVGLEDLIEMFSRYPQIHSYLTIFRRRFGTERKQRTIMDLF